MLPSPTPEQEAAIAAFLGGENFRLRAVAGSGKTSTLVLAARAAPEKRLLYAAFNRSVAREARQRFPTNVEPRTLHSLAYREIVKGPWRHKLEATNGHLSVEQIMRATGLAPVTAVAVRAMLEAFLRSQAKAPGPEHIPPAFATSRKRLLGQKRWAQDAHEMVRAARSIWKRMQDPEDPFGINHDTYVRLWRDGGGRITGYHALLVDEAQDLDPQFAAVLERSPVQRVYVGDPLQQIYSWRGAVNAMQGLPGRELLLSRSFRFGEQIARYVRWAVTVLTGSAPPLHGAGKSPGTVLLEAPHRKLPFGRKAVLARTNAGVINATLEYADLGVHVVGGVKELSWLLEDAQRLREGRTRPRPHPELAAFQSWGELLALSEEIGHPVASILLKLERQHGALTPLARALERIHVPAETHARVVVSTVHRAKGREWDHVELAPDFPTFDAPDLDESEPNVLYVALTRAKKQLVVGEVHEMLLALEKRGPQAPTAKGGQRYPP